MASPRVLSELNRLERYFGSPVTFAPNSLHDLSMGWLNVIERARWKFDSECAHLFKAATLQASGIAVETISRV